MAVPNPLAYIDDLHLLLAAEAPGVRLADLYADGEEFERWLPPVAATLAALHDAPVELPAAAQADEAAATRDAARTLATLSPGTAERGLRLAEDISAELAGVDAKSSPVHGDFHDDQVLVSPAGVVLLDFDRAKRGSPLLDVGSFAARLTERDAEGPRRAFLEAYAELRPAALRHATLFEAAALLRLAVEPFRRLDPAWPTELERLIELAATRFGEHRPRRRPRDGDLPQLDLLLDRARMAGVFARVLDADSVEVAHAAVARHKPRRRCVLRYEVVVGRDGSLSRERIYGKTYASERGPRVYATLRTIATGRAWPREIAIPDPVGYDPSLKLVLQREVEGAPSAEALFRDGEILAPKVAGALHALHTSGLELERRHGLDDELAPLEARMRRVGELCPALRTDADRSLRLLRKQEPQRISWRWRPVHRDFYHDHVLVRPHGLTLLDFDDAAMSDPAVDVANFLAHLRLLALQETESPNALASAASAFAHHYSLLDPAIDTGLVRSLEGATLLRLAEIHLPRANGVWLASRLLEQSEAVLEA